MNYAVAWRGAVKSVLLDVSSDLVGEQIARAQPSASQTSYLCRTDLVKFNCIATFEIFDVMSRKSFGQLMSNISRHVYTLPRTWKLFTNISDFRSSRSLSVHQVYFKVGLL